MAIRLMLCFARSGGSILNQCLGSMENVVMLSEINPLGGGWGARGPESYMTPYDQAKHWYGIELSTKEYLPGILELERICEQEGKHLIIRDWSYINFIPYPNNNFSPPLTFLNYELLKKSTTVIPFAFTRDVIDVWISLGTPNPEKFFPYYLNYILKIKEEGFKIYKYEEFCKTPGAFMQGICNYLQIPFSHSYQNFNAFDRLNGDVQLKGEKTSRGKLKNAITLLPRKLISQENIRVLNNIKEMRLANRMMGYIPKYKGRPGIINTLKRMISS